MHTGWAGQFFVSEKYFEGNKILVALGVLLLFNALWLAANWWARRRDQVNLWLSGSALGLVAVALMFTAWFLDFTPLTQQPWLMFGFVFLIDLAAIAVTWLDDKTAAAQSVSGFAVFGLLALWTEKSLSNELLNAALAFLFHLCRSSFRFAGAAAATEEGHHASLGESPLSHSRAGAGTRAGFQAC